MKKNNLWLYIGLLVLIVIVLLFPTIHSGIERLSMPKVEGPEIEEEQKPTKVDEKLLESLHYPIMRSSEYAKETYYTRETFKVSDMSNNDKLLTAFLDIEEVSFNVSSNSSCSGTPKQFNAEFIGFRIKNILSKDLNYELSDFYVPNYVNNNYVGTWSYDSSKDVYYYKGICNPTGSNISYYTLDALKEAKYGEDEDIIVYKYLGFAKIENNQYIIYSDASMTKEIKTGTFTDMNNLNAEFNSIDKKELNVYMYTFKDTLCSYNDYCLYEGKWVS